LTAVRHFLLVNKFDDDAQTSQDTMMAKPDSISFLHIPIELRLEIYKHLVPDCLASGSPNDLTSLSLVCHSIHQDLSQISTARVRALFDAQTAWIKRCKKDREIIYEPLRLLCSHDDLFGSSTAPKLTITLPEPLGWTKWPRASPKHRRKYSSIPPLEEIPSFEQLLAGLRSTLRLHWAELTINLCISAAQQPDAPEDDSGMRYTALFHSSRISQGFFTTLSNLQDDGGCDLGCIDRFVLNYSNAHEETDIEHIATLRGDCRVGIRSNHENRRGFPRTMARPVKAWLAKVEEGTLEERGWKLVFDQRDGLDEVEGALVSITREDRKWKMSQLFTDVEFSPGWWDRAEFDSGHESEGE
jgi:hypothetical protein